MPSPPFEHTKLWSSASASLPGELPRHCDVSSQRWLAASCLCWRGRAVVPEGTSGSVAMWLPLVGNRPKGLELVRGCVSILCARAVSIQCWECQPQLDKLIYQELSGAFSPLALYLYAFPCELQISWHNLNSKLLWKSECAQILLCRELLSPSRCFCMPACNFCLQIKEKVHIVFHLLSHMRLLQSLEKRAKQ